jgi:hypothetical protein
VFEAESAANNYPRLPVRVDAPVLAWLSRRPSVATADEALARLDATPRWPGVVLPRLRASALQRMRLQPAARSWLR